MQCVLDCVTGSTAGDAAGWRRCVCLSVAAAVAAVVAGASAWWLLLLLLGLAAGWGVRHQLTAVCSAAPAAHEARAVLHVARVCILLLLLLLLAGLVWLLAGAAGCGPWVNKALRHILQQVHGSVHNTTL